MPVFLHEQFQPALWSGAMADHSRRIVNVSMCLLLCIVQRRINGPIMKPAGRWLIHLSNLEVRLIGRESQGKQNLFPLNSSVSQPRNGPLSKHNREQSWATVKCYGLDSNWQSGWARRSGSRAGGLCVCNWLAFVYSRGHCGGWLCVCV